MDSGAALQDEERQRVFYDRIREWIVSWRAFGVCAPVRSRVCVLGVYADGSPVVPGVVLDRCSLQEESPQRRVLLRYCIVTLTLTHHTLPCCSGDEDALVYRIRCVCAVQHC